ncbi:MAG: Rieske (2Fe-2S) protein, partial [Ilumatobacteraceae bacterium]
MTTTSSPIDLGLNVDDLAVGSMRMARADGHRVCLVRTASGVHALDHACPHEAYGLTQGTLDGELLTCGWHNWKFRVDDGTCVLGEEDVRTHPVTVGVDGSVAVSIVERSPEEERARLFPSLRRGIANAYVGQVSRDVVRLLRADTNPGELIWEAVAYGAPRADFGWGHSIASATDCLAMVDLYDG